MSLHFHKKQIDTFQFDTEFRRLPHIIILMHNVFLSTIRKKKTLNFDLNPVAFSNPFYQYANEIS